MPPPGPSPFEVIGQLPLILGDRLKWMETLHRTHGDIVRIPLGPRAVYGVFHPDLIRDVLVTRARHYDKGRTFQKTAAYMGQGLGTSEGSHWQRQRRLMNPHFKREALKGLTGILSANVDRMLGRWSETAKAGGTLDLAVEFHRLAMTSIARSLFGGSVEEHKILDIIEAFKVLLKHTTRRTLNPIDIPEWLPLPSNRRFQRSVRFLDSIVYGMIRQEQKAQTPSPTLLGTLVRARDPETGEQMDDKQLRDEVLTMFLAGTDTTGNTLSWVFYNLHKYPLVQSRVVEEIREAGENLENLDYTRRVVDETLRLFPQNWVGSRDTVEGDVLGGIEIPPRHTVFLGVYVVHRRPDFWKNAEEFDPDRFLPAQLAGRHPMQYLPFGAGSRKCIGYDFALMEICLTLSRVLNRFEFEVLDFDRITRHATWSLWPRPGIPAKVRLRADRRD